MALLITSCFLKSILNGSVILISLTLKMDEYTLEVFRIINRSTRKKIIGHTQSDRDKNYLMEPLSPSALQNAKQQLDKCDFNFIKGV